VSPSVLVRATEAKAAIEPTQATLKKSDRYLSSGLFVGGEHQRDVALSDVRRQFSEKSKLERIVLEMKPVAGSSKGRASFFQVNVNSVLGRVQIDISGMSGSARPLDEVSKLLEKSPLISKAELVLDPEDRSASLSLNFKKPGLKVEAYELTGADSGRLVIDVKE
jgi:hypothetical protein